MHKILSFRLRRRSTFGGSLPLLPLAEMTQWQHECFPENGFPFLHEFFHKTFFSPQVEVIGINGIMLIKQLAVICLLNHIMDHC